MSIGKRIAELRNKQGLTQQELADRLYVTDKAVSKWEREGGEPNLQALIEMSKIFEVSLDYLLTGLEKEKVLIMSLTEKVISEDDLEKFKKLNHNGYNYSDDTGQTIIDYVYKYKSKNIFNQIAKEHNANLLLGEFNRTKKYINEFMIMCFETKNYDLLNGYERKSGNIKPIINILSLFFSNQEVKKNDPSITILDDSFVEYLIQNEDKLEDLMNQGDIYWGNAISKVIEKMTSDNNQKVEHIVSFVEEKNQKALEYYNSKKNDYYKPFLRDDGVYGDRESKLIKTIIKTSRQSVLNALSHNHYELAERLNALSGNSVSEHEFKMDKINKNQELSSDDKLIESVLFNGIVDIDKLIALDNYKLYKRIIELPTSKVEMAINLAKENKLKELFSMTLKENMSYTLEALRKDKIASLEQAIRNDYPGKNDKINDKYVKSENNYKPALGKNTILFEDIIKHKDINFFAHACKTDLKKLDWALEEIVKERPKDYDLILLLLDNGAKLHKRWYEDDGWGYEVGRDEIDDVGTQLLRNQIEIFMKEKK